MWLAALLLVCGLLAVLAFPWGISVYYVERAGRQLEAGEVSASSLNTAQRALVHALNWYPENAQAYRLLARVHTLRGDQRAALTAWARFVTLRPSNPLGLWELAQACERLPASELALLPGHTCGADEPGRQAVLVHLWRVSGYTAESFIQAGDAYREVQEWPNAEAFYRRALLLDPASAAAWQGMAQVREERHGPAAALEFYADLIAVSQDADLLASAYYGRGQILADAQDWEEASLEFAEAVALAPDEGSYHLDFGWALFKAGANTQVARAELTTAADLLADNPWPALHLSQVAYTEEDYPAALEYAQRAVALSPSLFWGWMRQGMALRRLDRLEESEQALRRAIELRSDQAFVHAELGYTLNRQEKLAQAVQEFERAVSLAPGNAQYSLGLANAYRKGGQVAHAIEAYRRVLELDPDNTNARQALQELED